MVMLVKGQFPVMNVVIMVIVIIIVVYVNVYYHGLVVRIMMKIMRLMVVQEVIVVSFENMLVV